MSAWIYTGGQQYFKSGLRGSGSTIAKTSSYYLVDFAATLAAGVGNNSASHNGIMRAVLKGSALTSTAVQMAAMSGSYWITTSNASNWPKAGVIGELHDASQSADGAVCAVVWNGNSVTATSGVAMFTGISMGASNAVSYGLDFGSSVGVANVFKTGDVRFSNSALFVAMKTAVTANVTTTTAPAGSLGMTTHATGNATVWISDGSKWQKTV